MNILPHVNKIYITIAQNNFVQVITYKFWQYQEVLRILTGLEKK